MFWNDSDLAYLIYKEDISLAFQTNDKQEMPFDVPLAAVATTEFDMAKRSFVSSSELSTQLTS